MLSIEEVCLVDFMVIKEVVTASLDNMSRKELKEEIKKYKEENQVSRWEWKG